MSYKIALTACSDPLSMERIQEIGQLKEKLMEAGHSVRMAPDFLEGINLSPEAKAMHLMDCFRDPEVDYIFDVSGGDLANLVLPFLDYDVIQGSRALFFGFSDLTTVLNAIVVKAGRPAVNYQIRNLLYDHAQEQVSYFTEHVLKGRIFPEDLKLCFLRGSRMEGHVVGGNVRCFLKLAGTTYWPDMQGSILLLESWGGGVFQMMTALEQYRQMGVFEQIDGIILGTFSQMEQEQQKPSIQELVLSFVPEDIPVAVTRYVGHYTDAKAILLGRHGYFE